MRVLFPFVGDTLGGSHISTAVLARALRDGFGVMPLFAVRETGRFTERLDRDALPWAFLPKLEFAGYGSGLGYLARTVLRTLRLKHWLLAQNVDLVHTQDLKMHLTWTRACNGRLPHVLHQRQPIPTRPEAASALRNAANRASAVVAVSEFTRQSLAATRPVSVIHNPVNASLQSCRSIRSKHRITIGLLSNDIPRKRLDLFADLARVLCDTADFRLAGSLTPERSTELLARARGSVFTIDGPIDDSAKWLAEIDILVCPARSEAFGRTLVEGLAAGCQIVASADSGHLEIIEDGKNGHLFAPDDLDDLQSTVQAAISQLATWPRDQIARETESRFSPQRHAEAVYQVYRSVLP